MTETGAAALDGPYTWGESVTWTAGRILVPLNRDGASVADLELDEAGARELAAHLTGVLEGDLSIKRGLVHFPADWTEGQRARFRAAWDEAQR